MELILEMQRRDAAAKTDELKKAAHRRFADAVLALTKVDTIAVSTPLAESLAAEVGLFQAIRAALVKSSAGDGPSVADRAAAIRQIVSRAVVSTGLRVIATALVQTIRDKSTVDWPRRDAARAQMRVAVKRILRKFGYPRDLSQRRSRTSWQRPSASRSRPPHGLQTAASGSVLKRWWDDRSRPY